jgi:hypothetical protein
LLRTTWGWSLLATTSLLWDKLPHDCSSIPWMDDGTPTPNRKKNFFSLSPSPQNPKKEKIEPSLVPSWNFYYGPIPFHNRMDTYCAINRVEWAILWNSGVLQFKKGPRPPPLPDLFALYVRSVGQMGCTRHDGRAKPAVALRSASSQIDRQMN